MHPGARVARLPDHVYVLKSEPALRLIELVILYKEEKNLRQKLYLYHHPP